MNRRLPAALVLLVLAAASARAQYPDPGIITRPGDWTSPDPRNRLNPYNPLYDDTSEKDFRTAGERRARALLTEEEARAAVPAEEASRISQARAEVAAAGLPALAPEADPAEAMRRAEDALQVVRVRTAEMARMRKEWNAEFRKAAPGLRGGTESRRHDAAVRTLGAAEILRRLDGFNAEARAARSRLQSAKAHAAWRRLKALVF